MVSGVTTKAALVDFAIRGSVERQTHVLEIDNCVDGFFRENLCSVLVYQIVSTFDRVKGVPLPAVLLDVGESCSHTALGGTRVRASGIELRNYRGLGVRASFDSRPHSGATGADNHNIELVLMCGDVAVCSCGVSACHHVFYITSAQNDGRSSAGDPAGQGSKA